MEIAIQYKELYEHAKKVANLAYSPYSSFRVGAAILFSDGSIVTGVNVENRSYGLTNCAERSALYASISLGKKDFSAIAVATPDANYPVSPCGACRQVLSEFFDPSSVVVFGSSLENLVQTTIGELFPFDALHELAK